MNNEACNQPNCGSCTRQDVQNMDGGVLQIINYVGSYVVSTMMAPEVQFPNVGLALLFAPQGDKLRNFPIYLTTVGFLGDDSASVEDSKLLVSEDDFLRFYERHNGESDAEILNVHNMIVESVRDDLLDLSTPITGAEFQKQAVDHAAEYGLTIG